MFLTVSKPPFWSLLLTNWALLFKTLIKTMLCKSNATKLHFTLATYYSMLKITLLRAIICLPAIYTLQGSSSAPSPKPLFIKINLLITQTYTAKILNLIESSIFYGPLKTRKKPSIQCHFVSRPCSRGMGPMAIATSIWGGNMFLALAISLKAWLKAVFLVKNSLPKRLWGALLAVAVDCQRLFSHLPGLSKPSIPRLK